MTGCRQGQEIFLYSKTSRPSVGPILPFITGLKRPGREVDHSSPFCAEVKKWNCISIAPCAFVVCTGAVLNLPLRTFKLCVPYEKMTESRKRWRKSSPYLTYLVGWLAHFDFVSPRNGLSTLLRNVSKFYHTTQRHICKTAIFIFIPQENLLQPRELSGITCVWNAFFLRRTKASEKNWKVLLKLQYMFGPTVNEARHLGYQKGL